MSGMYVDIHSYGGYVFYPWGYRDAATPDDKALQALGRKVQHFNGYRLWAGSQPHFVYASSGDSADYMYAVLGVAALGLEIGDSFQQECASFEGAVLPKNLPALMYLAKLARRPFREVKGPDVFDLEASYGRGEIRVTARASDSEMVSGFATGSQKIKRVQVYLDVHPDDEEADGRSWMMLPTDAKGNTRSNDTSRPIVCSTFKNKKKCRRTGGGGVCKWISRKSRCRRRKVSLPSNFESGGGRVRFSIDASAIVPGRHVLYAQATDERGYTGPVSSVFVEVLRRQREPSQRGSTAPNIENGSN